MTISEIFDLFAKRKEELLSRTKHHNYYYIKEYLEKKSCNSINDLFTVDIWEYLSCLFGTTSDKYIEDVQSCFDCFKDFLNTSDLDTVQQFVDISFELLNEGAIPDILEYFIEKDSSKAEALLKKISFDDEIYNFIKTVKAVSNVSGLNFIPYFELLQSNCDEMVECMSFYIAYRDILHKRKLVEDTAADLGSTNSSKIQKVSNKILNKIFMVEDLLKVMNKLSAYIHFVEKEEKAAEKECSNLDKAMSILKRDMNKEEIQSALEVSKLIKDDTIRCEVLRFIFLHNLDYCNSLSNILEEKKKNSDSRYQSVLHEYGLVLPSLDCIRHNNVNDLKIILKILKQIGIDNEHIIPILKITDLNTTNKIKSYVDKGFLSVLFLNNSISIFDKSSEMLSIYENSLKQLDKYNINPGLFRDCIQILITDPVLLEKNIEILVQYDLLKSIRSTRDYFFLQDLDLTNKIDKLLFLGYEDSLVNNLSLLNSKHIKRLEVLKSLNIPIEDEKQLIKVLNGSFFIKDSELDYYIENALNYHDKMSISLNLSDLSSYKKSSRVYSINGVFFSINKVERAILEGGNLYDALFYDVSLSEEEYFSVMQALKPYIMKK